MTGFCLFIFLRFTIQPNSIYMLPFLFTLLVIGWGCTLGYFWLSSLLLTSDTLYLRFDEALKKGDGKKAFRYVKDYYHRQGYNIADEANLVKVIETLIKKNKVD